MATRGFDPTFGLAGTVTTAVSGFGGVPLAITTGPDGRETMLCSSFDQTAAAKARKLSGSRFRDLPLRGLKVVSIPTGPITGLGRNQFGVFGPDPVTDFLPHYAVARPNRFAVLGTIVRANRAVPMIVTFGASAPIQGVAPWSVIRQVVIPGAAGLQVDRCGLFWSPDGRAVILVAPALRGGRRPALELRLVSDEDPTTSQRIVVPSPASLDLPPNFTIRPKIGGIVVDRHGRTTVGLSWEGLDPGITRPRPRRPIGTIDQSRASAFRLRRVPGPQPTLELDPTFADNGFWLAKAQLGSVTTTEFLIGSGSQLVLVGRARRPATSLFVAALDRETGAARWVRFPADGVLERPAGVTSDAQDRILVTGGTAEYDQNNPHDVAEAVVACLTEDGDPAPGYGNGGLSRFRLHGGTHPTAIFARPGRGVLVASAVPWGWQAAAVSFHPCLTRLTDTGSRDPGFGTSGVARHNGIGESAIGTVDRTGRVWSAGQVRVLLGYRPGQLPGDPDRPDWLQILTACRLTTDGELDPSFGQRGIAPHQIAAMLPPDEQFFEITALVPLADGKAICSGFYRRLVPAPSPSRPGTFAFEDRGSWLARLTASGPLDPSFGNGGLLVCPDRYLVPLTELADGSIQGFESTNGPETVRLAADGSLASGFGTNGRSPLIRTPSVPPTSFFPDGEWYAPVDGPSTGTVGLIRYRDDGTLDLAFGAADPVHPLIDIADIAATGKRGPELTGEPAHMIRLAHGSLLVIWSVRWLEKVMVFTSTVDWHPLGLLLLAFNADGTPRPVAGWNNRPWLLHPNPVSLTMPQASWLGWHPTCILPQPDQSIIVGLRGDDPAAKPPISAGPQPIRQTNYFCRLLPPDFQLDPTFGTGFAAQRVPGDDDQTPLSLGATGGGQVVAAIGITSANVLGVLRSPDLPLDGSIGVARLV